MVSPFPPPLRGNLDIFTTPTSYPSLIFHHQSSDTHTHTHMQAELLEKKAAIIAKQEEVRQRIAQEKAIREAEQPAIDQVTIQRKHLKEELERMMVKNESARSATSEGKAEVVALRDAKRDLLAQVDSIKAETEVRKGQIVGSPARLKGELAALEAAVEAEQRAMDELDEHKRLLMRQTDIVAKAEKDVNKALRMISETEVRKKIVSLYV